MRKDPTGRALQLLSLLQTHRSWRGAELAERLEVTEQTVRRDVDRLRDLGYPVDATSGNTGATDLNDHRESGAVMFNAVGDINWLAVALSTVALTALGGVWSPALLAKPYAQALGRDPEQPPEMTTVSYVGPLVCGLFTVVASAIFVEVMGHHLDRRCVRVRLRRWNRIPGGDDDSARQNRIETGVRFAASWEEG